MWTSPSKNDVAVPLEEFTRRPLGFSTREKEWGAAHDECDRAAPWRIPPARENARLATSEDAALILLFSLVASGQIKLRRIDGWRKIAAVLNQHTAVAA